MKNGMILKGLALTLLIIASCAEDVVPTILVPENVVVYTMPSEEEAHEGTWLQWPHKYTFGQEQQDRYDPIWVDMTKALHTGEIVHIIAYDQTEKSRITQLLTNAGVDMQQVDFLVRKTEDVWVRDNGPIFVRDENDNLRITNWEFNGWGGKYAYEHDNQIPSHVSTAISVSKIDVNMVLEGGAIEVDGHGTLMATRSSILNSNRNPGLTQEQAETFFKHYLGVTNFVWLDGIAGLDITDMHIDGVARFVGNHTIATYSKEVVENFGEDIIIKDYEVLKTAKNAVGQSYTIVELPLAWQSEGSYLNYYVGNEVVVVPNFNESTDSEANAIIQGLYPNKTVVGVNVLELWKDGGAIHCVTQQQPK
ncbi:agmatine/peptidylarginine deiminase [Roseivirga sp. E12]|uniref:agmatine deiminase family protein n=1 Tax=Roseivirga sp. E12 TaxID=2819237 RepID=UPI001ABD1036|nr:agmatine deiminase family protein [Roseivirga sp. E12]MBO3697886.1 agmatine deiminase family protein [Roseivirga sp. E12]